VYGSIGGGYTHCVLCEIPHIGGVYGAVKVLVAAYVHWPEVNLFGHFYTLQTIKESITVHPTIKLGKINFGYVLGPIISKYKS